MSFFLTACGFIGTTLFGVAAIPTAYKTARAGASVGTPIGLAWQIFLACCFFYTYILGTKGFDLLVAVTAIVETASYGVILWYHYRPRQ